MVASFRQSLTDEFSKINSLYTIEESTLLTSVLSEADFLENYDQEIGTLSRVLTEHSLAAEQAKSGMAGLVRYYDLSTEEGIVLMCVAEALLRIPDSQTEKLLISDKLTSATWRHHLGQSESSFINVSTWGLALTGKILSESKKDNRFSDIWHKMIKKSGEGVIRQAVRYAIKLMSKEFVLGRNIKEALDRGQALVDQGYTFSFDMLGEAAMTLPDAERYFEAYANAIKVIGQHVDQSQTLNQRPGISVKLSALYPRYEFLQKDTAIPALVSSLKALCVLARDAGIALTVDAEEAERLTLSLMIFKTVYLDPEFKDWCGLGLAVQAYQRRASAVLDWVVDLSKSQGKMIQVRLVKGAYWDTEIKQAQMKGWENYPVFTRKVSTDIHYLACAKQALQNQQWIYPQFATHNAYTVAAILTLCDKDDYATDFEFQNLQGMNSVMYPQLKERQIPCRVYAPVGSHEDLLPYLVRRLLENGANSSFVNQLSKQQISMEDLLENPYHKLSRYESLRNPNIPLPEAIFENRLNSAGFNITNPVELNPLLTKIASFTNQTYNFSTFSGSKVEIFSPADQADKVGSIVFATTAEANQKMQLAHEAFSTWSALPVESRVDCLETLANLLESHRAELIMLMMREAGKVLLDCNDEIREAVDFCRYYAQQARVIMSPQSLTGYTGEDNTLTLSGRGVMVCISPWNFPIAIFLGQIMASLAVGNTVVAKPAESTTLVAERVMALCYQAGIPETVLCCVPGEGKVVGEALLAHPALAGVLFTGSTLTAKRIQQQIAEKPGAIVPLIAETGGLNAMIADSSCLPEQLVQDVIHSAFGSAGQRCSALRILFCQADIADKVIEMLKGAMAMVQIGHPASLSSDIGPLISAAAFEHFSD